MESALQLRVIASARTSGDAFDLRCEIREKLIDWMQREIPSALPRTRQETIVTGKREGPLSDGAGIAELHCRRRMRRLCFRLSFL